MGKHHLAALPTALYGGVLLALALACYLLQQAIIASQGEHLVLCLAVGRDWKGRALYALVALMSHRLSRGGQARSLPIAKPALRAQRPTQPPHTGNTCPTKQAAGALHR